MGGNFDVVHESVLLRFSTKNNPRSRDLLLHNVMQIVEHLLEKVGTSTY